MTRRKKEIRFEAEWNKHVNYGYWIGTQGGDLDVIETCQLGKRIIRALGKKAGKIRITLERVE